MCLDFLLIFYLEIKKSEVVSIAVVIEAKKSKVLRLTSESILQLPCDL
jgi:hypothetical protein